MTDEQLIQRLREIEGEIRACYDGWDGAIENGAQPVPIQDLDFWSVKLTNLADLLEEDNKKEVKAE